MAREHRAAGAALESIAANEVRVPVREVPEARDIKTAGPPIVDGSRLANPVFHQRGHARPHHVLAEVVSDVTARVADAVRVGAGLRQQHQPCRLERRRRQHDDLRSRFVASSAFRVKERNTTRLAAVAVDQDLANNRIGPQRQVPGVHRRIDQARWRVEGGVNIAPADAAVACAAPVTPAAILVVFQAVGGHAGTVWREHAAHLLQGIAQRQFGAGQFRRALKDAVGQMGQVLLDAGDPKVSIDAIVIRLDVLVGDWPVLAITVTTLRLEVIIRQPEREPAPDVRLATETPRSHPGVTRPRVGMVFLVDDDVLGVVGAAPALNVAVDLGERRIGSVRRLANRVLVERQRMVPGRHLASSRMFVRPLHGLQLFVEVELFASLEHQHFHAVGGQHMRRHPAGRARTDDDGVVGFREVGFRLRVALYQSDQIHTRRRPRRL